MSALLLIMFYRLNAIVWFHESFGIFLCFELGCFDSGLGLLTFHKMNPRTFYYQIVTKSLS